MNSSFPVKNSDDKNGGDGKSQANSLFANMNQSSANSLFTPVKPPVFSSNSSNTPSFLTTPAPKSEEPLTLSALKPTTIGVSSETSTESGKNIQMPGLSSNTGPVFSFSTGGTTSSVLGQQGANGSQSTLGNAPVKSMIAPFTLAAGSTVKDKAENDGRVLDKGSISQNTGVISSAVKYSSIQNKNLEDIILKWTNELDGHVKSFHKKAIEISNWDNILIEQGNKISELHEEVLKAEGIQKELDMNIGYLCDQQTELEKIFHSLNEEIRKIYKDTPPDFDSIDTEREKIYGLAETIEADINKLDSKFNLLVEKINVNFDVVNDKNRSSVELIRTFNNYLSSLQWIDDETINLKKKFQLISKSRESLNTEGTI